MVRLVAIAGGIGAGKSVVSRILRTMGYPVYDTDSEAKRIMDSSDNLKKELVVNFGDDVVNDGQIDRKRLGEIVFNDKSKLLKLNELVHWAVIADLLEWCARCDESGRLSRRDSVGGRRGAIHSSSDSHRGGRYGLPKVVFVETAILYESGLDAYVDEVWEVTAPADCRIGRIVSRSQGTMSDEDAKARIKAQTPAGERKLHNNTYYIINDDYTAVLPQVCNLLQKSGR